jgi:hypothetical protein
LLVNLRDDPLFAITIPSKTQAYLAAGRPIIMGVAGDAADMIRSAAAGVVVPPEDAKALASAIETLADMPAEQRAAMGEAAAAFWAEVEDFFRPWRPAVPAMTTSRLRALPALTASKLTDAGSPPSWLTISTRLRSAHTPSCSRAAARKVSAANLTR